MSNIYSFYEERIKNEDETFSYVCKLCKKEGKIKTIKAGTTSNLISHMKSEAHIGEFLKFELTNNDKLKKSKKAKLDFGVSSPLACAITQSPKYVYNRSRYKERLKIFINNHLYLC
jgi:hypothetical protein